MADSRRSSTFSPPAAITIRPFDPLLKFNNASPEIHAAAARLFGSTQSIQKVTSGLWPRQCDGQAHFVAPNTVRINQDDNHLVIRTNYLPDHGLCTNNPNCAFAKDYLLKFPKQPAFRETPIKITPAMQQIG